MTTTPTTFDRCRQHLDRSRLTFRLFVEVLELLHEHDDPTDQTVATEILQMLAAEMYHEARQLDQILNPPLPLPDSEGGLL